MKRKIAFLCLLAMVLGVVNPAVFAVENNTVLQAEPMDEITVLEADTQDLTVQGDMTIDLNGHHLDGVTVLDGTLYCMDSSTADYTVADGVYGKVTNASGNVKAAEGYLQIDGSFHAVDLEIYAMTLRATSVGVYYKSRFAADEVVAQQVESFGIALSVFAEPDADNLETSCGYSAFTGFAAGAGANEVGTSTLLTGIMKDTNGNTVNSIQAAMPICGRAYIKTADGYFFGHTVQRSLQQQVEAIDAVWEDLKPRQKAPVLAMLNAFDGAMETWNIPNIQGVQTPGVDTELEMPIDVKTENGVVIEAVTLFEEGIEITVPAGKELAAGAESLTLTVVPKETTETELTLGENHRLIPMDVHVDGLAATDKIPVLITLKQCLPAGLNDGNVQLYHVEQDQTLEMTRVETPVNHNEFSYDPLTGTVVLAMASFSEVSVVTDTDNPWDGTSSTAFAGGTGTQEDPYLIATAQQLAYFRDLVDGGNKFQGQFVKLNNNINLGNVNFDPIGYGYECQKYMSDGRTFNGTFDGGNNTIFGLYQNGWELGSKYSYSMAGGGLFASVVDATIKNLKILDANIVMECVDMGILVGYSQGNCIYENIGIYDSKIANYQRATGGVVGEVSPRRNADGSLMFASNTHTFKNVEVGPTVVVGSLWGDFDAPVGGVIGARWDDNDSTNVVMEDVTVAARLDVYNDVTSAYKWHAYRRAGMLIGNTDTPPANGKTAQTARADFLTCRNVVVKLGSWADYHYCQFTNSNNPGRSYPWVRVEEGENCSAYANPRYGHPVDVDGNQVTSSEHKHQDGDNCSLLISFGQLYGGGQGVYGATKHTGVTIENYAYTITYMYNGQLLNVRYITDNSTAVSTADSTAESNLKDIASNETLDYWVNAGSTRMDEIYAGYTKSVVLYPSFANKYTAMFIDQQGNVLASNTFTGKSYAHIKTMADSVAPPALEDCLFDHWEVRITDDQGVTKKKVALNSYTFNDNADVAIYPIYSYNGSVSLIPIDKDGDGETDSYQVGGFNNGKGVDMVKIPDYVNGLPITSIAANAFSSYPDLHAVYIPVTVEEAGANVMATGGWFSGEQITIYYEGTYSQWRTTEAKLNSNWDKGVGKNSRIFFLNGTDKVDPSQGYLQMDSYSYSSPKAWTFKSAITTAVMSEYTGSCDCDICNGAPRPDQAYWQGVVLS